MKFVANKFHSIIQIMKFNLKLRLNENKFLSPCVACSVANHIEDKFFITKERTKNSSLKNI